MQKWMVRIIGMFAMPLCMTLAPACAKTPYPIPLGTDTFYYGYLISGSKFGIQIGDNREKARSVLDQAGHYYSGEFDCESVLSLKISCSGGWTADFFRVRLFLRDGTLILRIENDVVSAIIWDFHALPPLDF